MFPFSISNRASLPVDSGEQGKIIRKLAHAIELAGGDIETLTDRAVQFKGGVFSVSRTSANQFARSCVPVTTVVARWSWSCKRSSR